MSVLVLIGPNATQPLEIAREVAARRALTVVIDLAAVAAALEPMIGADPETKRILAIDAATAMASRLDTYDLAVIIVERARPSSTLAYREGLVFVSEQKTAALTADPFLLAARGLGREPFSLVGVGAWRAWRANMAELRMAHPTHSDFDLIIDCSALSRPEVLALIEGAL